MRIAFNDSKQEFILNDDNIDECHNFIADIEKYKNGTIEIKIDAFSINLKKLLIQNIRINRALLANIGTRCDFFPYLL